MAVQAVAEGIHVLSSLAQTGVCHLKHCIGFAFKAFSRERTCASLAGVVAGHAASLSIHEESEVASAGSVSGSCSIAFAGQTGSAQTVQTGCAGVVARVAVSIQVVHVVADIASTVVLLHDDSVGFASQTAGALL